MNPFKVDDRVQTKVNSRRNGSVIFVLCNECTSCKDKKYGLCTAEADKKDHVLASFRDAAAGTNKRYKYKSDELMLEPPLPLKPEEKRYDQSAKDIRPLGTIQIDIPLIVSEDDVEESETESDNGSHSQGNLASQSDDDEEFFDQYMSQQSTMDRPI